MKPVLRYQSRLLYRRSYKPQRLVRIGRTPRLKFLFRPARAKGPFWTRVMNRGTRSRTRLPAAFPDGT